MSYALKLMRKEIKEQHSDLSFLDNEESILPFTNEQFEALQHRLQHYSYNIENQNDTMITYNYNGGELGITAYLTKTCLTFTCSFNEDGIFEILQTSDELSDEEFLTLNLQDGTWSGMCLDEDL